MYTETYYYYNYLMLFTSVLLYITNKLSNIK